MRLILTLLPAGPLSEQLPQKHLHSQTFPESCASVDHGRRRHFGPFGDHNRCQRVFWTFGTGVFHLKSGTVPLHYCLEWHPGNLIMGQTKKGAVMVTAPS